MENPKSILDEFWTWLWKKEHIKSNWLLPLLVTVLLFFVMLLSQNKHFKENLYSNLLNLFLEFLLVLLVINIPRFLMEKMTELSKKLVDQMNDVKTNVNGAKNDVEKKVEKIEETVKSRISDLSHLIVFQTDNHALEDKLKDLLQLKSSPRWIYSKYISKILSTTFEEFKIKFSKTAEYSNFSSEIMKECSSSVYLTSSMTPYEWLSSLAKDESEKKNFFDNISKDIQLNESNHSMVLRGISIDKEKKKRVVCLSAFDYDHLFLFERGLFAYLEKNDGIETVFCKWDNNQNVLKPLQYEYALYDESLLFKFEKGTKELEIIKDGDEFEEIQRFFVSENVFTVKVDALKQEIQSKKQKLLSDIKDNEYQIPHKYSYLFHDNWTRYLDKSFRFGDHARNAIADLIDEFKDNFSTDDTIDLIEIGAGNGDKIDLVCDRIGSEKIASYYLVDISQPLISSSLSMLRKRFDGRQTRNKKDINIEEKLLDFCEDYNHTNAKYSNLFLHKTVLILNNSTLFSEFHFPWDELKWSKRIFITLDKFELTKADDLFDEYYKARDLFLGPLKIFGIPIIDDLVNGDRFKTLFKDNRNESDYTNDKPYYKIYFNLKKYIQEISGFVDFSTIDNNITKDESYKKEIENFINQEKIIVLSSLKFKESEDLKLKVESYFQKKLGNEWNVEVNAMEDEDSYLGIYIEKKKSTHKKSRKRKKAEKKTQIR